MSLKMFAPQPAAENTCAVDGLEQSHWLMGDPDPLLEEIACSKT